jgi:hypothetical protein
MAKTRHHWEGKDCFPRGDDCAFAIMLEARASSKFHDDALMRTTKHVNALLADAANRPPYADRSLHFIILEGAPFLAWLRMHEDAFSPDAEPEKFANLLQLPLESSDIIQTNELSKTRPYSWEVFDGELHCYSRTQDRVPSRLWEAEAPSAVHDATLIELTGKINALLGETAASKPRQDVSLCLLEFQGRFLPVWAHVHLGARGVDDAHLVAGALRIHLPSIE